MANDLHDDRSSTAPGHPPPGEPDARSGPGLVGRGPAGGDAEPDADPAVLGPPIPGGAAALDRLRTLLPGGWRDASAGPTGSAVRRAAVAAVAMAVGLVLVGGWLAFGRSSDASDADRQVALPGFGSGSSSARPGGPMGSAGSSGSTPSSGRDPGSTAAAAVQVHAAGAVVAPGVHRLPAGSRVADLVAAAGGLAPDADVDRVNLAAVLVDGSRVYVPRRGEASVPNVPADGGSAGGGTGSSAPKGPVDINTATVEELDTLPGVGPTTAQAIVDHRTRNGPFRSVEDLAKVRGIGPAKLAELRPLVTV